MLKISFSEASKTVVEGDPLVVGIFCGLALYGLTSLAINLMVIVLP